MAEGALQSLIRVEAARRGVFLWRNNTGVLPDRRGIPVRFGLANDSPNINKVLKSSDLIGIAPGGRFVAIEVKHPGWRGVRTEREVAQQAFINLVIETGGRAGFVSDISQLDGILA